MPGHGPEGLRGDNGVLGTNPTDEPITSGLLGIWKELNLTDRISECIQYSRLRAKAYGWLYGSLRAAVITMSVWAAAKGIGYWNIPRPSCPCLSLSVQESIPGSNRLADGKLITRTTTFTSRVRVNLRESALQIWPPLPISVKGSMRLTPTIARLLWNRQRSLGWQRISPESASIREKFPVNIERQCKRSVG
jgi:hypothetical protein